MATVAEILLSQGQLAADARRARGGTWTPIVQSLANLPNQIHADRQAEQERQLALQANDENRQLRGLQRQEIEGRLTDADAARSSAQQEAEVRTALLDVLGNSGAVSDDGFDLPRARQYAESKGYGQLLAGALIEADREQDAASLDRRSKEATLAKVRGDTERAETADRQTTNQQGVRRMIGERVSSAPLTDPDRQTLRGMAFQENVALPDGLIEDKPDTRSLQQQANDALRSGDTQGYSRIMRVLRETASAGRAPDTPSFQSREVLNDAGDAVTANFDSRTGRYTDAAGQVIRNPRPVPGASETQDARKFQQAGPILDSVEQLSERINTAQGLLARMRGGAEKVAAQANYNDDVAEYQALVMGFTPLVARALGHTGVLTQQDVDSVKALFPTPGDSKTLRDRKIARIRSIIGQLESNAGGTPRGNTAPIIVDGFEVIQN